MTRYLIKLVDERVQKISAWKKNCKTPASSSRRWPLGL